MSNSQEYAGLTPLQLAMIKSVVHDDKSNIIDMDAHFTVDVKNKLIISADKRKLVQFSHNSERVTFDCDRYIEGHDIMLCNVKQIHYLDDGIYDIDDLAVNEDDDTKVTFSWLISGNATKQVLKEIPFSLILECVQEDGTCTYSWDTEENTSLYVVKGRRNTQNVAYKYADVLEQWKKEFGGIGAGSTARIGEVSLLADGWTGDASPYAQVVAIEGVTKNSQVDLTPSVDQLSVFYEKDLTFVTENDNGVVTVYAIGQKPQNDYTIQVTITEVIR